MTDFSISTAPSPKRPQAVEVTVHGPVNALTVKEFTKTLEKAMGGKASILILNLQGVTSIVSTALSYLADLWSRLEPRGGAIAVVQTDPKVRIVFTSLGLHVFFTFFETQQEARAFATARVEQSRRMAGPAGPNPKLDSPSGGP